MGKGLDAKTIELSDDSSRAAEGSDSWSDELRTTAERSAVSSPIEQPDVSGAASPSSVSHPSDPSSVSNPAERSGVSSDTGDLGSVALGNQTFKLGKLLGRGGMAEVFLAHKVGPGGFTRKVVVKRILTERAGDETYVQRFLREASLAAQLHHPAVVEILELGYVDDSYYIVMEYVDGRNLHDLLRKLVAKQMSCPPAISARIVADVASALDYAHNFVGDDGVRRRIVHRDVSTTNIMVSFDGMVKLVDFGVAKDLDAASLTIGDHIIGKPLYLPPESLRGGKPTLSWDIYALGMVLYTMLAGRPPFELGKGSQGMARLVADIARKVPPPPSSFNPEVPETLDAVAQKALTKSPDDRHASAADVQRELESWLLYQPPVTPSVLSLFLCDAFARVPKSGEISTNKLLKSGSITQAAKGLPTTPGKPVRPERTPWTRSRYLGRVLGLVGGAAMVGAAAVGGGLWAWNSSAVSEWWSGTPADSAPESQVPDQALPEESQVPAFGTLVIHCRDWGFVSVDGREVGTCPMGRPLSLRPGDHRVILEVNRRLTERIAAIVAGETTVIDFDAVSGKRGRNTPIVVNPTPR